MADYLIPPWLRISASAPGFVSNTAAAESIFTGAVTSVSRTGDKVRVTFNTENANNDETYPHLAALKALRAKVRGQANRVWYTPVAYTRRGSFPATELLTNNTFASGTTGWASNNTSVTTISVADRRLRIKRVANAATSPTVLCSSVSAAALYAPYVARVVAQAGRGSMLWDVRIRDLSDSSAIYATSATSQTTEGMLTCSGVPYDTDPTLGVVDRASGKLAGDYMDVSYTSLSRCALVDNGPNLLLQSDEFDTSWTATRASVDDQTAGTTAPDGTSTADSIIEDSTASQTHYVTQAVTVSSSVADFALGVALKAGTRTWAAIAVQENTGSTSIRAYFNLSTGAVGAAAAGANWSGIRSFIAPLGDGWYACYVVGRKTNAATSLNAFVQLANADGGQVYSGDGTSNIYAWRATLAQASVPTRLSQTTTTATSGTSQTGSSLHLKGLPASTTGLLLPSDWVQIGNQLCMVTASLDSDAAGLGYLQLAYPPRTAPANSDPIIVHEPMGRFVLTENAGSWSERPGGFSDHDFSIVESLDQ